MKSRTLLCCGLAATMSGCTYDLIEREEEVESNRFLDEIQGDFWESLDYDNTQTRGELSGFVSHFDEIIRELEEDLDNDRYHNPYDLAAIGRVFFYFGHMMHSNVLVTLEQRIQVSDLANTIRFSRLPMTAPEFEHDELLAQMDRSVTLLERAVALRPDDRRPHIALLSARTTRARVMLGQTSLESVKELIDYGTDGKLEAVHQREDMRFPNFDIMVVLLTLRNVRDPNLRFHYRDADQKIVTNAHMLKLVSIVQRRVDPDLGPGFVEPTEDEVRALHFVALTAPILRSDYFMRYAHDLWSIGQWDEARAQLYVAQTGHNLIRERLYPLLELYPITETMEPREEFAELLHQGIDDKATSLWRDKNGQREEVKIEDVFMQQKFIAPYLCSNCHAEH